MAHIHRREVDGIVESTLARICLDGMEQRHPVAVILQFKWGIEPTTLGHLEGYTHADRKMVGLSMLGGDSRIFKCAMHEAGHVVLVEHGVKMPHCECCADRAGRAIAMGRVDLVRRLRRDHLSDVIAHYAKTIPADEVTQRIWEVRQMTMRSTG